MSFVEAVVALSLAGTLVGVGAFSLGTLSSALSLDSGSRTVAMALSQARVSAITRGSPVTVTFGSTHYVAQAAGAATPLVSGQLPSTVTMETTGAATFSPLGTVGTPVTVTLDRGGETRLVHVRFTGEVDIE